jgi:peptidoglycan hydrolase-like protein with peptidoglycan-binding domain
MKKYVFIILTLALTIYLAGCGKKKTAIEELPESLSMEELGSITTLDTAPAETKPQVTQTQPASEVKLEPLPPSGPYKPTPQEIQTALKNAGYYTGAIDGKIGPKTLKAIEEFQKANGLNVDGKIGPKTWAVLSKHLNPAPAPTTTAKEKSTLKNR